MKRIKVLRNSLGLTQLKFAERIGLQRQTIAQYEIGSRTPSPQVILAICREFRVREEWLRDGIGEIFSESETISLDALAEQMNMRPEEKELLKTFIQMPQDSRDVFLNAIRGVLHAEFQAQRAEKGQHLIKELPAQNMTSYKPVTSAANLGGEEWGAGHDRDVEMLRKAAGKI